MSTERRPCACRGYLEANPRDPVDVELAVRTHQGSNQHQLWRRREEHAGRILEPIPPAQLRRV